MHADNTEFLHLRNTIFRNMTTLPAPGKDTYFVHSPETLRYAYRIWYRAHLLNLEALRRELPNVNLQMPSAFADLKRRLYTQVIQHESVIHTPEEATYALWERLSRDFLSALQKALIATWQEEGSS